MSSQNQPKKFYRARIAAEADGLWVIYDEYVSLKETPHYHFCVSEHQYKWVDIRDMEEAKRCKIKLKKIAKACSRFAFESKEDALENLRYRKRLQITHLKRELAFAEKFLVSQVSADGMIDDSRDLVNDYLRFY